MIDVDQAEARLSFAAWNVETDATAGGEAGMATDAHQFAQVRVCAAVDEQFGDPPAQPSPAT
jgi:hypothetical protein